MARRKWLVALLAFVMVFSTAVSSASAMENDTSQAATSEPEEVVQTGIDPAELMDKMPTEGIEGTESLPVVEETEKPQIEEKGLVEDNTADTEMSGAMNTAFASNSSPSGIAITTEGGFAMLRANPNQDYYLDADLDWSKFENKAQLPEFSGNFDGNGHTISNLNVPLFEKVMETGTIKNIKIENAYISGTVNVGGLASINNGTISFVAVSGKITGETNVGGIVGQMNGGTIEKAASTATISAKNDTVDDISRAGGLVGYLTQGAIKDSSALGGPITGAQATGGFVGEVNGSATISTSYTVCRVFGIKDAPNRGAFIGLNKGGTYNNCYFTKRFNQIGDTGATNNDVIQGINELNTDTVYFKGIKNKNLYQGFDFNNVWTIDSELGSGFPVIQGLYAHGTCEENPIKIDTVEELKAIPHVATLHYKLMKSFDLSNVDWVPIFDFAGNFDGNGNTLSNITVNDGILGGVFAKVINGRVENLTVDGAILEKPADFGDRSLSGVGALGQLYNSSAENCMVKNTTAYGRQCSAAMFGVSQDSKIKNCHVEDSNVYGVFKADTNYIDHPTAIGGLVGEVFGSNEISDCTVSNTNVICDIYADGQKKAWEIGGLIGDVLGAPDMVNNITNCHVYGGKVTGYVAVGGMIGSGGKVGIVKDCSSSATVEGYNNVGGFVGTSGGGPTNEPIAKYLNCSATGDVKAQYIVGGFAGLASAGASITKCYATGTVEGTGYWSNNGTSAAGGFVGHSYLAASITDCYATGDVVSRKGGGGFVGANQNLSSMIDSEREPMIKRCYATGNVTATDLFGNSKAGGFVGVSGFGSSTIMDCYATGDVSGFQYIGGFAGEMDSTNAVNCYTTSKVATSKEGTAGGFVGIANRSYFDQLRFLNCIYNKDTSGADKAIAYIDPSVTQKKNSVYAWPDPNWPVNNIKGYTSEQMKNKDSYKTEGDFQYKPTNGDIVTIPVTWDFEKVWSIEEGKSTPYLTALGDNQLIQLQSDSDMIDTNGTVQVNLIRQIKTSNGAITWDITGAGTKEASTDTSVTVKAKGDGIIHVSVLVDGVKQKTIQLIAGNGGEKGISAIFASFATLTDGTAHNVDLNPTFQVKFTEPINLTEFNKLVEAVKLTGFASKQIDVATSFSDSNTMITIIPKEKLANGTTYNLSLAKEVKGISGLTLKGITAMQFLTNSFEKPLTTIKKENNKVDTLKAGETYTVNAEYINNIPNFEEDKDIFEEADVYIVVRGGMGARTTYGGDIISTDVKKLSLLNKKENAVASKGTISTEFTLPADLEGNVYVDVYTWNAEKSYAKALPVHLTYQIAE